MTAAVSEKHTEAAPTVQKLTIAKAINAGLRKAMEADDKVVLMGEDIGRLGGVFRVTEHLQRDFGEDRVIDAPLAESGIVGTAVGLALRGYRPVVEIQFDGFVYPAFDQIVSQVAKMRARSKGNISLPMVIRIPCGGGIGAVEHHSESNEAYFAHTAGLKVIQVANPTDAYWMIQEAIASNDPVVFFEPKRRYHEKAEVDLAAKPPVGLSDAQVVRQGTECTLCASVEKTGRLVVVHEASEFLGMGAEVAAQVQQRSFYHLEAPVLRVTGFNVPYPPSKLEEEFLPDLDRVLDAVDRSLAY